MDLQASRQKIIAQGVSALLHVDRTRNTGAVSVTNNESVDCLTLAYGDPACAILRADNADGIPLHT
jgi:molybdopterin-binding protein